MLLPLSPDEKAALQREIGEGPYNSYAEVNAIYNPITNTSEYCYVNLNHCNVQKSDGRLRYWVNHANDAGITLYTKGRNGEMEIFGTYGRELQLVYPKGNKPPVERDPNRNHVSLFSEFVGDDMPMRTPFADLCKLEH